MINQLNWCQIVMEIPIQPILIFRLSLTVSGILGLFDLGMSLASIFQRLGGGHTDEFVVRNSKAVSPCMAAPYPYLILTLTVRSDI